MDGEIEDIDYQKKTNANAEKIQNCIQTVAELQSKIEAVVPSVDTSADKKLLKRLMEVERLDKALADCLIDAVEVYCGGKINIIWKFSYFCDIIDSADSQTVNVDFQSEISNRVWLYFCSSEGWDKLNDVRQKVLTFAEGKNWSVIGESFDNAGLSITATGFKEMQRAVRQGRVDYVVVPSLEGVSTSTAAYQSFEKAIRKRKVKLYDMFDNLLIG